MSRIGFVEYHTSKTLHVISYQYFFGFAVTCGFGQFGRVFGTAEMEVTTANRKRLDRVMQSLAEAEGEYYPEMW
jgi:hypothetical protein